MLQEKSEDLIFVLFPFRSGNKHRLGMGQNQQPLGRRRVAVKILSDPLERRGIFRGKKKLGLACQLGEIRANIRIRGAGGKEAKLRSGKQTKERARASQQPVHLKVKHLGGSLISIINSQSLHDGISFAGHQGRVEDEGGELAGADARCQHVVAALAQRVEDRRAKQHSTVVESDRDGRSLFAEENAKIAAGLLPDKPEEPSPAHTPPPRACPAGRRACTAARSASSAATATPRYPAV